MSDALTVSQAVITCRAAFTKLEARCSELAAQLDVTEKSFRDMRAQITAKDQIIDQQRTQINTLLALLRGQP